MKLHRSYSRAEWAARNAARAEAGNRLPRVVSTAPRPVINPVTVTPRCNCGTVATETVTLTGPGWTLTLPCCTDHAAAWERMAVNDGFLCKRTEVQS